MDSLVAFSRRRRRLLLVAAAGAAAAIGAYKIYHLPAVAARRRRLVRLAAAVAAFLDAAASSADAAALGSSDLADFVRSGSDELPRSVTQLAKLAASPEASATVSALSEAVTTGILRAVGSTPGPGDGGTVALSDRFVDKLFSESGVRLASAVAGSFARQLVTAFYSAPSPPGETSSPSKWVDVVATGKGRKAISNWVEVFVGTAVGVFIEKTIHINTYEQLFEGLTNPSHDAKVKELLVSVCNGAVETLVKSSHHVMSNANSKLDDNGNGNGNGSGNSGVSEGWVETVSSTLAVPNNRKFVLDVTGRVTFETVRSFLEFVLWKMHDGARKSGDTMFDSGLHAMRKILNKRDVKLATKARTQIGRSYPSASNSIRVDFSWMDLVAGVRGSNARHGHRPISSRVLLTGSRHGTARQLVSSPWHRARPPRTLVSVPLEPLPSCVATAQRAVVSSNQATPPSPNRTSTSPRPARLGHRPRQRA